MTPTNATRRSRIGGWFLLFIAVVALTGAWFTWDRGGAVTREPNGFADGGTDQNDPARFRIVGDGIVEDAATGLRRNIPGITESALATLVPETVDAAPPDDLRNGFGPRPVFLKVPSIDVDTTVIPIGVDPGGALAVPRRADLTGWWSGGQVPGEDGPTVIVGHFDSKVAAGVFSRLKEVEAGDLITLDQSDGSSFLYAVVEVERLQKTAFPTTKVYGKTPNSTLRLVTCGGKWDRKTKHYVDNTIVYADYVSYKPPPPGFVPATTTIAPSTTTSTTAGTIPSYLLSGPVYPGELRPFIEEATTTTLTTTTTIATTTTSATTTTVKPTTTKPADTTTSAAPSSTTNTATLLTTPPTLIAPTESTPTPNAEPSSTTAAPQTPPAIPVTAQTTVAGAEVSSEASTTIAPQ
jgi:LPXTG-site transpeptidase (sortase) family protein